MDESDEMSVSDSPNVAGKMWRLIPRDEKRRLPLVVLSLAIGAVLEVVGVGLLVPLVNLLSGNVKSPGDSVLEPIFNVLNAETQIEMLTTGFLLIGLVVFGKNCYLTVASYFQNRQTAKIRSSIEKRILGRYLHERIIHFTLEPTLQSCRKT